MPEDLADARPSPTAACTNTGRQRAARSVAGFGLSPGPFASTACKEGPRRRTQAWRACLADSSGEAAGAKPEA